MPILLHYPVRYSTSALRVLYEDTSGSIFNKAVQLLAYADDIDIIARNPETVTEGRSKTGNEYDENKVYERQGLQERRPPCLTSLAVDGDELSRL